jgi:hypothetical protein
MVACVRVRGGDDEDQADADEEGLSHLVRGDAEDLDGQEEEGS